MMRGNKEKKHWELWTRRLVLFPVFLCFFVYLLQKPWAHRKEGVGEKADKIKLDDDTSYDTFFEQTGLGKDAIEKMLKENDWGGIEAAQEAFLDEDKVECVSIFGWFTKSDRIPMEESVPLVNLEAGDILVSFSTHSMGWRHGHAGLALDSERVLECTSLGKDSRVVKSKHWRKYSNYMVLRVKDASKEERKNVAAFAEESLQGIPYRLTVGFWGEKAGDLTKPYFGLQCAYLVWYAWQMMGYDLDSDGGRLVTAKDLACSKELEIVQIYGIALDDIY